MSKLLLDKIIVSKKCKDITNKKFNNLTAIHPVANHKKHGVTWLLKCDCGSLHNALLSNIIQNNVRSCGCLVSPEVGKHKSFKDLTGQKFGKLLVIKPNENRVGKSKAISYKCLCDCGKVCNKIGKNLKSGNTMSCGCSARRLGKNNHLYIDGRHSNANLKKNLGLIKKYNISLNDFNCLKTLQNNSCAICGNQFKSSKDTSVDHDHETNQVRGLLCNNCNRGIGFLQDNPKVILNAYNYLSYKLKKAS